MVPVRLPEAPQFQWKQNFAEVGRRVLQEVDIGTHVVLGSGKVLFFCRESTCPSNYMGVPLLLGPI